MSYTSLTPPFHGGDAGSNPARVAISDFPRETASVKPLQHTRQSLSGIPIADKSAQSGRLRISFATNGDNVGLECPLKPASGRASVSWTLATGHPLDSGQSARRYSPEVEASL